MSIIYVMKKKTTEKLHRQYLNVSVYQSVNYSKYKQFNEYYTRKVNKTQAHE